MIYQKEGSPRWENQSITQYIMGEPSTHVYLFNMVLRFNIVVFFYIVIEGLEQKKQELIHPCSFIQVFSFKYDQFAYHAGINIGDVLSIYFILSNNKFDFNISSFMVV